jgi:hypothetical protein
VEETPVATFADSALTDIASLELSRAEEKDPAPKLSKTVETASGKIVEITIRLGPDEDGVLKLLSATELQKSAPASFPLRELAPDHAAFRLNAENVIDSKKLDRASSEKPASAFPQCALTAPIKAEALAPIAKTTGRARRFCISPLLLLAALIVGFAVRARQGQVPPDAPPQPKVSTKTLIDQIVTSESQGDSEAKNHHSSAAGLAQFVEGTWLDLVKRHRPDIAATLSQKQILKLRADPELSRFLTGRYVEQNASLLSKRGLPATPGSLYLAHFAGPGGAAAILAAPESADAATVIADADRRPGVTRQKILSGNPFMKNFTAKDLKDWAELKMQSLNLSAAAAEEKSTPSSD